MCRKYFLTMPDSQGSDVTKLPVTVRGLGARETAAWGKPGHTIKNCWDT